MCHLSLKRTSNGRPPYMYCWNFAANKCQNWFQVKFGLDPLTNSGLSFGDLSELNDTAALRASTLEENLGKLDLAGRLKELDKVFIGSRPRQLHMRVKTTRSHKSFRKRTLRTIICWLGSAS